MRSNQSAPAALVLILVFVGGFCALSWELIWQSQLTLATGSSARATALTLFCFSLGLALGSRLAGSKLPAVTRLLQRPYLAYGLLELAIGFSGFLLPAVFRVYVDLDTVMFRAAPAMEDLFHLAASFTALAVPTMAMGASIPVLARLSASSGVSIALLYAANIAGACGGILCSIFLLLPAHGLSGTGRLLAAGNAAIFICTLLFARHTVDDRRNAADEQAAGLPAATCAVIFLTGFATFALEVIWFRALRSAFWNTAQTFGIILFSVLLALAFASAAASRLSFSRSLVARYLALSGLLILLATPLIERVDLWAHIGSDRVSQSSKFGAAFFLLGPTFLTLGIILPVLLAEIPSTVRTSRIYAVNTLGSLFGSLLAAWVLLPALGSVKSAWLTAALLLGAGLFWAPRKALVIGAAAAGFVWAISMSTGVGETRVIGAAHYGEHEVFAAVEGPDATVAAVRVGTFDGVSTLLIDGFAASTEHIFIDVVTWMAHLPMLLHPKPQKALVICFGTGNTLNKIRREGAEQMDIVEINPRVFGLSRWFPVNENVLDDPRVRRIVMDGRAWLRRTDDKYDVITLDPLPPSHSGMNALYSREFYASMRDRLNPGGMASQWFPIHLLSSRNAKSIARAFTDVFPNAELWMHPTPPHSHGILVGRNSAEPRLDIPNELSFARNAMKRSLTEEQAKAAFVLSPDELRAYASGVEPVTDDNQLLSYRDHLDLLYSGRSDDEMFAELGSFKKKRE